VGVVGLTRDRHVAGVVPIHVAGDVPIHVAGDVGGSGQAFNIDAIGLIFSIRFRNFVLHSRFRDISNNCKVLSRIKSPVHCCAVLKK
jgi:hypothetical protein